MIRDTFENNAGLCKLFKHKILERAQSVGFDKDLIDFDAQIDMKGSYHENLRTFYRQYPQLSKDSDYFRLKPVRALSGAALEQSWQSYVQNTGHETQGLPEGPTEQHPTSQGFMPELTITYNIGGEAAIGRKGAVREPESMSMNPMLPHDPVASPHRELLKLILDGVTEMAGEQVTKTILQQIGREIGRVAFPHPGQVLADNLVEALDHALSVRGLGRVIDLKKVDHALSVTYVCTIKGSHLYGEVAANPTCHIMRGIVSRWLESFVQKKVENIETACASAKSHLCVFRITFAK